MPGSRRDNGDMTDGDFTADEINQLRRMLNRQPAPRELADLRPILDRVPGDSVTAKAKRVGVSRWTWYRWWDGYFRPAGKHAQKLARLTGAAIDDITG